MSESQQRLADYLNGKSDYHVVAGNGTDVRLSVAGRRCLSSSPACSPIRSPTRLINVPPMSAAVSSPTVPLAVFTTTIAPVRIQSDGSIVERDANSSMVTTWRVEPVAAGGSRVRATTTWNGAGGIGGFFERTFAPKGLARIYDGVLANLDGVVRG